MEYKNAKTDEIKIMIVDDCQESVNLLKRLLDIHGYQCTKSLTDSRMAMKMFLKYQPDLLLLNLNMPYVDGFDILKMLRHLISSGELPVMVTSSQDCNSYRKKAFALGAKAFIVKPFNPTGVIETIHKYFANSKNREIKAFHVF